MKTDRVTFDFDEGKGILVSLDLGELTQKYKTNQKINFIMNKLKNSEEYFPDGYISVREVNQVIVFFLEQLLEDIGRHDREAEI